MSDFSFLQDGDAGADLLGFMRVAPPADAAEQPL